MIMSYIKADFNKLASLGYGVGFHWTTWTVGKNGVSLPFEEAVNRFDVNRFAEQAERTGAGFVLFTTTHLYQFMACPNPAVERILPGRTTKRDLIMEIADALDKRGIKLMLYYHHCLSVNQDPEWRKASGMEDGKLDKVFDNYCEILTWMGKRYKEKAAAFWFDAGYDLNKLNAAPWERMTRAAKAGYPDRLVAYNSGIENQESYTEFQDYWAGEVSRLNYCPRGGLTVNGLPWFSLASWHANADPIMVQCGEWGLHKDSYKLQWFPPCPEEAANFYKRFKEKNGTVAFNLLIWQDGEIYAPDLKTMEQVAKITGRRKK